MDWEKSFEEGYKKVMEENNNVVVRINGKLFRCQCGCNVFHHPKNKPDIYACNACDLWYEGD